MESVFEACVSCQDCVPLAWRPRSHPLSDGELFRLQDLSMRALRAEPADEHEVQDAEMLRLHEKLDCLMESIGKLLAVHQPVPPARNLKLSRRGAAWSEPADGAHGLGQIGVIELHLHPRLVQPLLLPGRICRLDAREGAAEIEVIFEPLSELLEGALERHVFRRHRRAVAETRHRGSS